MLKKYLIGSVLFIFLGVLAGCGSSFSPNDYLAEIRSDFLMQGRSASYADGYIDGCASGRRQAGDNRFVHSKNEVRYKAEKGYFTGWEQGLQFCREEAKDWFERKKATKALERKEYRDTHLKRKAIDDIWDDLKK